MAIDPEIKVYVEERLTETRHQLRNEFTAAVAPLITAQTEAQARSSQEHAAVRSDIAGMHAEVAAARGDIAELRLLESRVNELERHDVVDDALNRERDARKVETRIQRRWIIGTGIGVAAVVVAAIQIMPA